MNGSHITGRLRPAGDGRACDVKIGGRTSARSSDARVTQSRLSTRKEASKYIYRTCMRPCWRMHLPDMNAYARTSKRARRPFTHPYSASTWTGGRMRRSDANTQAVGATMSGVDGIWINAGTSRTCRLKVCHLARSRITI